MWPTDVFFFLGSFVCSFDNEIIVVQVRDYKNQLTASRSAEELLIDANSKLTTEVTDARQLAGQNKATIEGLNRDVKSYEVKTTLIFIFVLAVFPSCLL